MAGTTPITIGMKPNLAGMTPMASGVTPEASGMTPMTAGVTSALARNTLIADKQRLTQELKAAVTTAESLAIDIRATIRARWAPAARSWWIRRRSPAPPHPQAEAVEWAQRR